MDVVARKYSSIKFLPIVLNFMLFKNFISNGSIKDLTRVKPCDLKSLYFCLNWKFHNSIHYGKWIKYYSRHFKCSENHATVKFDLLHLH